MDRLLQGLNSNVTVLDVGGGGGRYALPLADRCRKVTVVEPSQSMVEVLKQGAHQAGSPNIAIVQSGWEEAEVDPADIVLCSHVLYGVENIVPFIQKLGKHATGSVLILMFIDSPQAHFSPLWKRVHRKDRITLPAFREFLGVLWEMDIYPNIEMLESHEIQAYESLDAARQELRRRLNVSPESAEDRRLDSAMEELLVETPKGLAVRGASSRRLGLISWQPE